MDRLHDSMHEDNVKWILQRRESDSLHQTLAYTADVTECQRAGSVNDDFQSRPGLRGAE